MHQDECAYCKKAFEEKDFIDCVHTHCMYQITHWKPWLDIKKDCACGDPSHAKPETETPLDKHS